MIEFVRDEMPQEVLGIDVHDPTLYRTQEEKLDRWVGRLLEKEGSA